MENSSSSTVWVKRCPGARHPFGVVNPILSIKRPLSSRWPSSSSLMLPWWFPFIVGAPWSVKRWLAGSLWARTAVGKRNRSTGRKWRKAKASRYAGGIHCWNPRLTKRHLCAISALSIWHQVRALCVCVWGGVQIENFNNFRAFCGLEHYQRFGFHLNVVRNEKLHAQPTAQFGNWYSSWDH